jgi:hypothetical protein
MGINQLIKLYRILSMTQDYKYTQQEWDKTVGWGKVPEDRKEECNPETCKKCPDCPNKEEK